MIGEIFIFQDKWGDDFSGIVIEKQNNIVTVLYIKESIVTKTGYLRLVKEDISNKTLKKDINGYKSFFELLFKDKMDIGDWYDFINTDK